MRNVAVISLDRRAQCRGFTWQSVVVDPSIYHEMAEAHPGIRVVAEGNVAIWLLASRAVIHNGCTAIFVSIHGFGAYLPHCVLRAQHDQTMAQYDRIISPLSV